MTRPPPDSPLFPTPPLFRPEVAQLLDAELVAEVAQRPPRGAAEQPGVGERLPDPHDGPVVADGGGGEQRLRQAAPAGQDRKSTRLNSSHANISYAVFCLKKK